MRLLITIPVLLSLVTPVAHARTIDAKALARYDISYAKCESRFPDMRGHRDEAYLNLWRVKPDEKALAELAAARKGTAYQSERKRVAQAAAKGASAPASGVLERECQALWAENQRAPKAK